MRKSSRLPVQDYVKGVLAKDRILLGRAITLVESSLASDKTLAAGMLSALMPHTGKSVRIGITGVPGVGKSTFIEAFGMHLVAQGESVAVLAVDPSSQKTKGSILGDKTRMEKLSVHPSAFVRPSATGSTLGGVARKTRETMLLCEAAGYSVILVETVGVGQSETAVHNMTDFFLLLLLSGAGDSLQGIKKGIVEMADLIAVNKADGKNRALANAAKAEYENALHLFAPNKPGWFPKVVTCSALDGFNIANIWDETKTFVNTMKANGWFDANRRKQLVSWFHTALEENVLAAFYASPAVAGSIKLFETAVAKLETAPSAAVAALLTSWENENRTQEKQ